MKVPFIGGTGIISATVSRQAVEAGIELYLLNRGQHEGAPAGAHHLQADIHQTGTAQRALQGLSFDAVVDWVAYTPEDIQRDLELFNRAGHGSSSSSAAPRSTRSRPPRRSSPNPPRSTTRSGSIRRIRSPARSCSTGPSGSRIFR